MGLSGLVSDGAKALVKLLSGLGCPSLPDMFHLPALSNPIARQQVQLQKQHQGLQEKLKTLSSPAAISEVSAQITVLQAQQDKLEIDRQDYQQNLHALSQTILP